MSFVCEYCDNTFTTKNHLSRHYKTDFCKKIQNMIKQHENEKMILENKIKELRKFCYHKLLQHKVTNIRNLLLLAYGQEI